MSPGAVFEPGIAGRNSPALDDLRWLRTLWPAAVLFHLGANSAHLLAMDTIGLLQLVMALAAAGQLIRANDSGAGVLAGSYLLILWLKLPVVGNHEIILGLTALGVLISIGLARRRHEYSWPVIFAPAGRVMLLVAYGFMAFSKLNAGFFDPAVSCAVVFAGDLLGPAGRLGSAGLVFAIATTLIELSIPCLLIRARSRGLGVAIALGFHFILALDPVGHVWDFSTALLPLFLLFAPRQIQDQLNRVIGYLSGVPIRQRVLLAAVLIAGHATTLAMASKRGTPPWLVVYPLWLIVGGVVLLMTALSMRRLALPGLPIAVPVLSGRSSELSLRFSPTLGIVIVLAALNGVGPYLEFRSAAAFNMYSNLQVAHGQSNHFIVGAARSAGAGEPYMELVSAADDPVLDYYRDNQLALPRENLDRYLRNHPEVNPTVMPSGSSGGERVPQLARSIGFGRPNQDGSRFGAVSAAISYKLGFQRAIDATGQHRCLRSWGPLG